MELELVFSLQDRAHYLDVLAGALQGFAVLLSVPTFRDLGAGRADAEQHPATAQLIEGRRRHRGCARRAGRHLHDAGADVDAFGLGRDPRERSEYVGAVSLGGPHGMEAEPVRLFGELERVDGQEAPITEVQSESHAVRLLVVWLGATIAWPWNAPQCDPEGYLLLNGQTPLVTRTA